MPDRLLLVEAELDLTVAVLAHPTVHKLAKMSQQPLAFLTQAREDLRGCVSVPLGLPAPARWHRRWWQRRGVSLVLTHMLSLQVAAEAPSHQPSGKLRHWLQKLETAKKTVRQEAPLLPPQETAGCVEASIILNLFQVVNDLGCVAIPERCT